MLSMYYLFVYLFITQEQSTGAVPIYGCRQLAKTLNTQYTCQKKTHKIHNRTHRCSEVRDQFSPTSVHQVMCQLRDKSAQTAGKTTNIRSERRMEEVSRWVVLQKLVTCGRNTGSESGFDSSYPAKGDVEESGVT